MNEWRWEIIALVHCEVQQLATAVLILCSKVPSLRIYPGEFDFDFIITVFTVVSPSQRTFHIRYHPKYDLHMMSVDIYHGKLDFIWLYLGSLKYTVNYLGFVITVLFLKINIFKI